MLIYIVGYGRSASTALSQLLKAKLNAINLGEIKFLYRDDFDDLLDPYWTTFKSDNQDLILHNFDKLKAFDNAFGFLKLQRKREYCKIWDEIFKRIGVDPESDIIIDSSKTTFNSYMRGFFLNLCYDEVYFMYPHRKYFEVIKSRFKGKNANLERGKRKSLPYRLVHSIVIGIPHITLTRLFSQLYHFCGMHVINLDNMESDVDDFIKANNLERAENPKFFPMIYGNRSRKNMP